jgi:arsenite methyltransferase
MTTTEGPAVEPEALRASVREKYREVATNPDGRFHFHTGRPLAARLGYDRSFVDDLPDRAVESFAGVADPFSLRPLAPGERVVEVGSGGGFDSIVAAHLVGPEGRVVGVDMTPEMLAKSRRPPASWGWATSSSARASPRSSPSTTAGPTSSSPTAS